MSQDTRVEQLMTRYLDGDRAAFSELYLELSPSLLRYLRRQTRDEERAQDLVQTIFVRVHDRREQYRRGVGARRWIMAIARNALRDDWRRRSVRKEELTADGDAPEALSSDPERQFGRNDFARRALAILPKKLRDAIELGLLGLTTAEAADRLAISRSNVKSRAHRGYAMIRAQLGDPQTIA